MNPLAKKLVRVYSSKPISDDVDQDDLERVFATTGETFDELQQDDEFLKLHNCVRTCKERIQRIAEESLAPAEQRKTCLTALDDYIKTKSTGRDRATIFSDLVEKTLLPKWRPEEEQEKYRKASYVILNWRHYFLSYTRRGGKAFNDEFMSFLKVGCGKTPGIKQRERENCVAKTIHELFQHQQIDGYFDESDLRDGAELSESIQNQLEHAFVLVQLIQNDALVVLMNGRNWPYDEFTFFSKNTQNMPDAKERFRFIVAADCLDELLPAGLDPQYKKKWCDVIRNTKHVCLEPKSWSHAKLRKWFQERAETIIETRTKILDALMR